MAVILKSMNMPVTCLGCPFVEPWDNASCNCKWDMTKPQVIYGAPRPEWCPLEPIKDEGETNERVL